MVSRFAIAGSFAVILIVIGGEIVRSQDWPIDTFPDKEEVLREYRQNYAKLQRAFRNYTVHAQHRKKSNDAQDFINAEVVTIGKRGDSVILRELTEEMLFIWVITDNEHFRVYKAPPDAEEFTLFRYGFDERATFEDLRMEYDLAFAPFQILELDSLELFERDELQILNVTREEIDGLRVVQVDFAYHIEDPEPPAAVYGYFRFLPEHHWGDTHVVSRRAGASARSRDASGH